MPEWIGQGEGVVGIRCPRLPLVAGLGRHARLSAREMRSNGIAP